MNLLDKKKSLGALVLGLFLFISCEENGPFGLSSEDVVPVDFTSVDVPITSSVVWLDSIQSSDTGLQLLGAFNSSTFGRMTASMYSRLNLNRAQVLLIPSESVFDSAKLNLQFIYALDTASTSRDWGYEAVSVLRGVTDTLHITRDRTLVSSDIFAESEMTITDFDSIFSTDFNSVWANQLFELLKDEDEQVENQEAFDRFFRGLALFPKAGFDQNIYGVTVGENSNVTLYYRDPGLNGNIDVQREHQLTFGGVPGFFNLTVDRSGTPTEFLQETNVEYTPGTGKRYIQAGAGIVTKINVSAFRDLISETPRIINLAEMTIGPIDVLDDMTEPPAELLLALTDERNTLITDQGTFRSIQSDGNSPIGNQNSVRLIYDEETRTYTGSLTSYFQTYFSGIFQRDEIFLYPGNMNTSVNGVVFDAEDIKLNIIYSELQ